MAMSVKSRVSFSLSTQIYPQTLFSMEYSSFYFFSLFFPDEIQTGICYLICQSYLLFSFHGFKKLWCKTALPIAKLS